MAIDLSTVNGLCFDVDGTLSDTDDVWVGQLAQSLRFARFLFKRSDLQPFARWLVMVTESPMNGMYHLMDRLSMDDNIAGLYSKLNQKRKNRIRPFQLMKGAHELLMLVHERYPLTVVSARDDVSTRRFLDQFELGGLFRAVVTNQTCEYTKPYPHPVRCAADSMGLKPEECLMIGDTTVDILAGKRAGAQTVGLLCGFGEEKELRRAGADLICKDLLELTELFSK
jgi:HAD superfamily hydrolase (TIGR01549 family)